MEKLLHYAWQHRMLPLGPLRSTSGRTVEVVDVGLLNRDAGPDFFNAKILVDGTMWAGSVEIHLRSSDWFAHGHDKDPAYNNVVLHVVEKADCEVITADDKCPPQIEVKIPESIRQGYEHLLTTMDYPRCHSIIASIPTIKAHGWIDRLLVERLEERSGNVRQRLDDNRGDWERAFFITLARNFGFGVNGDAFEQWGRRVPLHEAAKVRDNELQVEALFLGTAGLLAVEALPQSCREAARGDAYFRRLADEYQYLRHRFSLAEPMAWQLWKYLRMRPQNFPHIRLSQLARMFHEGRCNLSALLEADTAERLLEVLDMQATTYWQTHYLFGLETKPNRKSLTKATRQLLIINTAVPVLYAYGRQNGKEELCDRAIHLLESLPAEKNFILRQWQECGLSVKSAADSQALIQLKRNYCDRRDCLRCHFGYEFLNPQKSNIQQRKERN